MKRSKGFTLPEVLVAVFIFSLVIGGAVNLLVSSLPAQRISLQKEQVLREESSLAEYMGRAFRMAQKDLGPTCLNSRGDNYNLINGAAGIRFLTRDGLCDQIFLSGTQVVEQKSADNTANFSRTPSVALTSANATANSLGFALLGQSQTDNLQPRVTFFVQINGIQLQTTVSERNFDVQQ